MSRPSQQQRNLRVLMILVGVVAGMTGLAYASVPLYRLFCQVTGFGGTPQRAEIAPTEISDRVVRVTFTADVAGGLGWRFQPMQRQIALRVGENKLAYYVAENLESKPVTGRATFNVSPDVFGPYFSKIECFCFTEQTLQPGERIEMPVSFFIDPALLDDPALKNINDITLSYTFFRASNDGTAERKVGQARHGQAGGGQPGSLN
ncbi:cytochrome c oxidase assembly protein [Dongia deserti]|uniref:cytochrome c oxidase assembly protein n=1 Tax=Dongia deserti TaxID=2268030 RepID=UPI000E65A5E3|nr:cytochrome c oxidase assembly protein [Dongia deserti]